MATRVISTRLALDGEAEFKKQMSSVNSELRNLKTELGYTEAAFRGQANSLDALTEKARIQQEAVDQQKEKIRALSEALEEASEAYGESDSRTDKYRQSLMKAKTELINMEEELGDTEKYLDEARSSSDQCAKSIDEFGNTVEESGEKTSVFSEVLKANLSSDAIMKGLESIGGAVDTVVEGIQSAIDAAVDGLVSLAKQAIEGYAETEQLIGGVETLFGESAASAVLANANNAYKTAGLNANEYMETVTSFSASLISSLGGDTEKAVGYAETAIVSMADNANKMGSDISSIQTAYQGFAKQNYTMLDNLKLGYGGTKEEMERLLEDAEKLSGVEYDIDSFADIVDAIHVVQTELGIAGATSEEASGTISGSVAAMKAAWENLAVGFADENADIDQLMDNFMESAETAADNILPVVERTLESIFTTLEERGPDLIDSGGDILLNLIDGIVEAIPELAPVITDTITAAIDKLDDHAPDLVEAGVQILASLIIGIVRAIPDLIPVIFDAITTLLETLWDNRSEFVNAGEELIKSLWQGISNMGEWIASKIKGFGSGVLNSLKSFFGISSESSSGTGRKTDGSHAGGLDFVPFDGYRAELHYGERVMTATENSALGALERAVAALEYAAAASGGAAPGSNAPQTIQVTVPVTLNGRKVGQAVTEFQTNEGRANG